MRPLRGEVIPVEFDGGHGRLLWCPFVTVEIFLVIIGVLLPKVQTAEGVPVDLVVSCSNDHTAVVKTERWELQVFSEVLDCVLPFIWGDSIRGDLLVPYCSI